MHSWRAGTSDQERSHLFPQQPAFINAMAGLAEQMVPMCTADPLSPLNALQLPAQSVFQDGLARSHGPDRSDPLLLRGLRGVTGG